MKTNKKKNNQANYLCSREIEQSMKQDYSSMLINMGKSILQIVKNNRSDVVRKTTD